MIQFAHFNPNVAATVGGVWWPFRIRRSPKGFWATIAVGCILGGLYWWFMLNV